jgi:hypothetical protein
METVELAIEELIDPEYYTYWKRLINYLVHDNEEDLTEMKKLEEAKNIWQLKDMVLSPKIDDILLGRENADDLQLNLNGFAPMNQLETRALMSVNAVACSLSAKEDNDLSFEYVLFADRFFLFAKLYPVKRAVVINAMRCIFEHVLNDRVGMAPLPA